MNERTRLLSEQAHRSTADELADLQRVHNRTYDLNESAAIYNEKFAELIVAECIECADVVGKANYVSSYPNSTAHHIKQKIKEHFGVEE
jgi:hypothetical protein